MAVLSASELSGMLGQTEAGWFGSSAVRSVSSAAKSVSSAAKSVASQPKKLAKKTAIGRAAIKAVNKAGKVYGAVAPVLATAASGVPGIGSSVAAAIGGSGALAQGKSWAQAAKEAAISALPGGALAYQAALVAKDVATGKNVLKSVSKGALTAGMKAVGVPPELQGVVTDLAAGKSVSATLQKAALAKLGAERLGAAVGMVRELAKTTAAPARVGQTMVGAHGISQLSTPKKPKGFGGVKRRAWGVKARAAIKNFTGRDVGALDETGTVWIIKAGDTATKISQFCTGNPNRWIELRASNPNWKKGWTQAQIDQYGFPVRLNQRVVLPASWVKAAPAPAPSPRPSPSPSPAPAPSPVPSPSIPGISEDTKAKIQARGALAFWCQTDGLPEGSDITYGLTIADVANLDSTTWGNRDTVQARLFEQWGARNGYVVGAADGAWSQSLYDQLGRWAAAKAAPIKPTPFPGPTPLPGPVPGPTPTPTPTPTPSILPGPIPGPVPAPLPNPTPTPVPHDGPIPGPIPIIPGPTPIPGPVPGPVPAPVVTQESWLKKNAGAVGSMAAGAVAYFAGPYLR